MPWRHPVHERLTSTAAAVLGFPAAEIERLVQGNLDNDLCASPLGTLRRQWGNEFQPSHCLRKREHNGAGADRQALAAVAGFVFGASLAAWDAEGTGDLRRALFLAGKALHTVQDSYFHSDRNERGEITHVRSYLGRGADHDSTLDAGWDREGRPSVQYRSAEQASLAYVRLLQLAFASRERAAVSDMLQAFCNDWFRLAA
jgi:hypothetical protein